MTKYYFSADGSITYGEKYAHFANVTVELPEPEKREGYRAIPRYDQTTGQGSWYYEEIQPTPNELQDILAADVKKLKAAVKTADERYKEIDLSKASVADAKVAKIEQLKEACTNAIYAGFTSASTGLKLGFNEHDQQNFDQQYLLVVAGDNAGAPIKWKTKNAGIETLTEDQFRKLVSEAKDHKVAQQTKYWQLEYQVSQALTVAEVDAIRWS